MLRNEPIFEARLSMAKQALFRKEDYKKLTMDQVTRIVKPYEHNECALSNRQGISR